MTLSPLAKAWDILTLDPQTPIIGLVAAFKHDDHIAIRVKNGLQATLQYQDPPPDVATEHPQHPGLLVASGPNKARPPFMAILLHRISILAFLAYLMTSTRLPAPDPMEWVVAQAEQANPSRARWLQVNPHVHLFRSNHLGPQQIKLAWNKKTSAWMTHSISALQPTRLSPWPKRFLAPHPKSTTDQARTWVELQVLLLQSNSSSKALPHWHAGRIWLAQTT